eukprot:scaffold7614_cov417-Prasinococcus_capsulatus_cf.AAC.6
MQYSPEPADIGHYLTCILETSTGTEYRVTSSEPVSHDPELVEYADALLKRGRNGKAQVPVVVVQMNGEAQNKRQLYTLEIGSTSVAVKKDGQILHEAPYSHKMQVCGARGGGDAAGQGLFLALHPSQVFMLALQSPRERNAAILLVRSMAKAKGLKLEGPKGEGA